MKIFKNVWKSFKNMKFYDVKKWSKNMIASVRSAKKYYFNTCHFWSIFGPFFHPLSGPITKFHDPGDTSSGHVSKLAKIPKYPMKYHVFSIWVHFFTFLQLFKTCKKHVFHIFAFFEKIEKLAKSCEKIKIMFFRMCHKELVIYDFWKSLKNHLF